MDEIYQSAKAFQNMLDIIYNMKISYKKKLLSFQLDFKKSDFFHLGGLHYLKDLDLGRNPDIIFDNILNKKITDELLSKSKYYLEVPDNYVIVKDRICNFKRIEDCLDSKSVLFKYIKDKNPYTNIKADFMFEVSLNNGLDGNLTIDTYYVFFAQRNNEKTYRLVSFFNKNQAYKGDKAYWIYKEKVNNLTHTTEVLYERQPKSTET